MIRVVYLEHTKGGVKTGGLSIASALEERLYKRYLKDFVQQDIIKPVLHGGLWVSVWLKDDLHAWCISAAGNINDKFLELHRSIRK